MDVLKAKAEKTFSGSKEKDEHIKFYDFQEKNDETLRYE